MEENDRYCILGKLSSVLAHEIRNPLAGISAVTQVLDGKIRPDDPRKRYTSLILKEIDRVNRLVSDLLSYARPSKAFRLKWDLHELLDRVVEEAAPGANAHGIEIVHAYGSPFPRIALDGDQMALTFGHLVSNAIEAMGNGGRLTVRTSAANGPTPVACVSVSDSGHGSGLDDLAEMFSPFYTTKTKGLGLGLAVAAKGVEDHGGTISASRNNGPGLTFTIRLPYEADA